MDRIRKALDMARLERAQAFNPPSTSRPPPKETFPATADDFITELLAHEPPATTPVSTERGAATPATNEAAATATVANASAATTPSETEPTSPSRDIEYTFSRTIAPSAEILERNRVFNPGSVQPAAVAFRMLRTQVLQRMDAHGWRTLAIFSPGAKDGKSTTALNLAATLASDRLHTALLVEFDFKRPTLAKRLGFAPEFGSDDALSDRAKLQDCLYHPEGFERFTLMPARSTVDNSSEVLAGPRSRGIVNELRSRYPDRIVIFDLPPVLTADDALAFAPLVECGLVVAAEGRTRRTDLVRTIELLAKTSLVGTVLNRAAEAPAGY
jgi:Mrp family chromosome partitioning ATPase